MNTLKLWLTERQTMYALLALFYQGGLAEGLDILQATALLQQMATADNELLMTGARKAEQEIAADHDHYHYLQLLTADYQRLFIGPNQLLAPPWESVYTMKERLLFGEPELTVRQIYQSVGLAVSTKEPADHLLLELAFMARLCTMANENLPQPAKFLHKQQCFLRDHLLQWSAAWTADVIGNTQSEFWAGLAMITQGWLVYDLIELQKLL
jgi:TorA maturation chaperone TorD